MDKYPRPLTIALFLLCSAAFGQDFPKSSTDTVWVDSIGTHSGQTAVMDVRFVNADTIYGVDIPLKHSYPDIIVDSVSFIDTRIGGKFTTFVDIDTPNSIIHFGGLFFDNSNEPVEPGKGLLARIFLTIPEEYPTRLISFDTTYESNGQLLFISGEHEGYVPAFVRGYLYNVYAPSLNDSVWMDNAEVDPGQSFSIKIYAYNERSLYNISMPLQFFSDNIVFDSFSLAGTRANFAPNSEVEFDNIDKELLLSLVFSDALLLPPGTGPIAVLFFTCEEIGMTTSVVLDTTVVNSVNYFFQLGQIYEYVKAYPDFHPGTISINIATDIETQTYPSLPAEFDLAQNRPNPFNPTTSISYTLPERADVLLEVYNIIGQKVRTLVNKTVPAGIHTVDFDGRDQKGKRLASGIYMYRIRTDTYEQTRKMILLK